MDEERMDELAGDPRFIPGIYNYCDQWCERCAFTARCLNYAMDQEVESGRCRLQDAQSKLFWDTQRETFEAMLEKIEDRIEEMDFDLDEEDSDLDEEDSDLDEEDSDLDEEELQDSIRAQEEIDKAARAQPCSRTAQRYIEIADAWLRSHEGLLNDKGDASEASASADRPGTEPIPGPAGLRDCLKVIRWYQRQIYVKLCRAATGMIRGDLEGNEYDPQDANGSAKVALLGIERSIVAWTTLLRRFPDHEDAVLALGTLQRLLRQVEASFPDARAFRRPGFDTDETQLTD